tara:strand:- start:974 stop:1435 length:462 start_codon:yes stop_codon:yes gene_type:complete
VNITDYRPVYGGDIIDLVDSMRPDDIKELNAASVMEHCSLIEKSVAESTIAFSIFINDELAAIGGVCTTNILTGHGCPWLLGTVVLDKHKKEILKEAPQALSLIKMYNKKLENYVDARNKRAIRVLKWLGFNIERPVLHGPNQMLFHRFTMGI